jgi:transposase
MLGPPKSRALDRAVTVSLEDLVPDGNFYRHLERALDLSFVRKWVKDCYAACGRPSIDPVVFFKLELILFFEGLRSERQLIEIARLHLAHRWYLGYNLDERLPEHSSLTRIRERLGLPLFRRFFEHVVELCDDAGLIWGKELLVDATKVRANASMDSLVPRLAEVVDDHLVELFGTQTCTEEAEPVVAQDTAPSLLHSEDAVTSCTDQSEEQRRWDLLEACRLDPERPLSLGYQRLSSRKISRTDSDATPMSVRYGGTALGYQDHYLIDGGKARIILHALITPGDVMENQPFVDQLRRTMFRYRLRPRRVIGDTTYGTVENLQALEDEGIKAFMPLPDWEKSSPYYRSSEFTYDAEQDVYRCPQGELLTLRWTDQQGKRKQYRADPVVCKACPLREQCTKNRRGRVIYRPFHAELLERVRVYHQTPAFQKAMRKRSVWVEPLFAEAKQWHGLRQFRLRGLRNVNIEGLFVAAGQNLKRWLTVKGCGRRWCPTGSLTASVQVISTEPLPLVYPGALPRAYPPTTPIDDDPTAPLASCSSHPFFNRLIAFLR